MAMSPRLLRPRARGGFTPKKISDLGLWLDATDASSYTVATGVSEWRDLSGNSLHFSQGTANNQPLVSTLNGKTAFAWDATDDFLESGSTSLLRNVAGSTAFYVCMFDAFGPNGNALITVSRGDSISSIRQSIAFASAGAGGIYLTGRPVDGTATTGINGGATAASTPYIARNVFNYQAATGSVHTNGTQRLSATYGVSTNTSDTDSLRCRLGNAVSSTTTPLRGKMGEVVFYRRVLSSTEIAAIESYLSAKWGITVA